MYLLDYKKEMIEESLELHQDSTQFGWAVERAGKYCFNNLNYFDILIDKNKVILNLKCGFSHSTRALAPYKDLEFSKHSLRYILKEKYKQ